LVTQPPWGGISNTVGELSNIRAPSAGREVVGVASIKTHFTRRNAFVNRSCSECHRLMHTCHPGHHSAVNATVAPLSAQQCNSDLTWLESPPQRLSPHVTTEPFSLTAANALEFPTTCKTPPCNSAFTESELPPHAASHHVTTEPSSLIAAKANWFPTTS